MGNLNSELFAAIDSVASGANEHALAASVQELMKKYRGRVDPQDLVLASDTDVVAYAAYRLPATFTAAEAAFGTAAASMPGFSPATHLDVGGGMGAAVWAASSAWPSLRSTTVLEQSAPAISLGKRIARRSTAPAVSGSVWERFRLTGAVPDGPRVDLATMSYVLNELTPQVQEEVVRSLAKRARTVVLIEPGTPEGYARVISARAHLLAEGMTVAAPCPHSGACPIAPGDDWCHFSERLNRSGIQRRLKFGTLGFEDEKFSFVAATSDPVDRPANRVLRHPQKRKGLVSLSLCTSGPGIEERVVSKRQGQTYRAARKAEWGDAWPPPEEPGH
ncbi:small ribosomal subunit Rsm22 family protein [Nocardiopsis sp. L17-MgMaSL7]|uniref:small ribosomal subunit Rsm22 family protein n=1 Tax=Nocardiopsis sp. L17-MgMaSL7 TaxID=1938893 RepID=UPI000D713E4D|nr:small ribosomal subunit Rsm22 family protein [Nocardiopsis sp. L17-MgMaSL7]PWV51057.1 ribosomal protein RSM22 (predicted rRNA methylase) [Nocardiopsis sp. L17-MgMaSL7]